MKTTHIETELDCQTEALLEDICGRSSNRAYDDFGCTDWLDEFIEDYLGG